MNSADLELERFVRAQDQDGTYNQALGELRHGHKTGHWMWFVFPQIAGLGQSATSRFYAIRSLDEAVAYVAHPTLGPRLRECTAALLGASSNDAEEILGAVDALKLRSSMTLFRAAEPTNQEFQTVLDRFFAGSADAATESLL